jgi:hypothetical protein
MLRTLFFLFLLGFVFSCEKKETDTPDPVVENSLYFPPIDSDAWATVSPASLNWDEAKLNELYDFLQDNNTRAFII